MRRLIVVPHVFPSINEFINANRISKGAYNLGNAMKRRDQAIIAQYLPRAHFSKPVYLEYTFYEPSKRRDMDNISGYFHKIFQDALVENGVLDGDGWNYIKGYRDDFKVDRQLPRIEILIWEG